MKNAKPQRESITKESFSKLSEKVKNQKASKESELDIPMSTYVCTGCGRKLFDMNLYFYGKESTKCLWCTKFPKQKEKR